MSSQSTDTLIGQLIDNRYLVISKVARGGMATVYKVEDKKLSRIVALKIIHKHLIEDAKNKDEYIVRFNREAKAAANLDQANIVSIFDQGVFNGQNYLVMQFVDGLTLRTILNNKTVLSVGETLNIANKVLLGLDYAHSRKLIHRDIKPENIMIDRSGNVLIMDFGLVKPMNEDNFTQTGMLLGTPAYISPESIESGSFNSQTDIYSVGILIYELLVGKVPFKGDTQYATLSMAAKHNVPNISNQYPQIHLYVANIISMFTSKDLEYRPKSAAKAISIVNKVTSILSQEESAAKTTDEITEQIATQKLSNNDFLNEVKTITVKDEVTETERYILENEDLNRTQVDKKSKKNKEPKVKKPVTKAKVITVLILLALLAVAGWWWFEYLGPNAYKTVPADLIEQSPNDAVSEVESLGLTSTTVTNYSSTVAAGLISDTIPAPNSQIKFRDETLTLVVSKGIHYVLFPANLTGLQFDKVNEDLSSQGFKVKQQDEYSISIKKGAVIETSLAGGAKVPYGEEVVVSVSKGPKPHNMVQAIGEQLDKTATDLLRMHINYSVTEQFSDDIEKGVIISQSVNEGEQVFEGSTVALVVSKGPKTVVMPNVVGIKIAEAHKKLDALGLKYSDTGKGILGLIQTQSEKPGKNVKIGTVITLHIV
jgi:serine/threonine-protein kinase